MSMDGRLKSAGRSVCPICFQQIVHFSLPRNKKGSTNISLPAHHSFWESVHWNISATFEPYTRRRIVGNLGTICSARIMRTSEAWKMRKVKLSKRKRKKGSPCISSASSYLSVLPSIQIAAILQSCCASRTPNGRLVIFASCRRSRQMRDQSLSLFHSVKEHK